MKKILFVCTGNTCRSVMAEKICNSIAKKQKIAVKAESTGIHATLNQPATPQTIAALKKLGICNIKHKANIFCLDNLFNYDYCIAVTKDIKNYIGDFNNVYCFQDFISDAQDIADPFGKSQSEYDYTCKQIQHYIEEIIGEFK